MEIGKGEWRLRSNRKNWHWINFDCSGFRMGYIPDHLHPRPSLACPYGHHPRYLGIAVRSPPKGSTYANWILPRARYAYVTLSLCVFFVWSFFPEDNEQDIYYPINRGMESKSNISMCIKSKIIFQFFFTSIIILKFNIVWNTFTTEITNDVWRLNLSCHDSIMHL